LIYIDSCVAVGYTDHDSHIVDLPSSWDTYTRIDEVEILGIEQTLYLSFTGYKSVDPHQVYFMEAYSSNPPTNLSQTEDTWKFTLEMTPVVGRDPDYPGIFQQQLGWRPISLQKPTTLSLMGYLLR